MACGTKAPRSRVGAVFHVQGGSRAGAVTWPEPETAVCDVRQRLVTDLLARLQALEGRAFSGGQEAEPASRFLGCSGRQARRPHSSCRKSRQARESRSR